jgi:hypothetical protein
MQASSAARVADNGAAGRSDRGFEESSKKPDRFAPPFALQQMSAALFALRMP